MFCAQFSDTSVESSLFPLSISDYFHCVKDNITPSFPYRYGRSCRTVVNRRIAKRRLHISSEGVVTRHLEKSQNTILDHMFGVSPFLQLMSLPIRHQFHRNIVSLLLPGAVTGWHWRRSHDRKGPVGERCVGHKTDTHWFFHSIRINKTKRDGLGWRKNCFCVRIRRSLFS
jgi:hypothetical protein